MGWIEERATAGLPTGGPGTDQGRGGAAQASPAPQPQWYGASLQWATYRLSGTDGPWQGCHVPCRAPGASRLPALATGDQACNA